MATEHTLRRQVSAFLKTLAPDVFFEKRWGGGIYGTSGVSDYVGVAWGFPFAIEIKHPIKPKPLRKDQVEYQRKFRDAGGFVTVAHSVLQVSELMRSLEFLSGGINAKTPDA